MIDITEAHPIGSEVTTIVYGIGGRSERVTGSVVDYRRKSLVIQTACHGRLVVEPAKVVEG